MYYSCIVTLYLHDNLVQINKKSQRALGRSPEEKVKGNSGANYREPQWHNLNNFGRRPLDDCMNQI